MAKVSKRTWTTRSGSKKSCWKIDFIDLEGNRIKKSGYATKAEAEKELAESLSKVNKGTYIKESANLKFADVLDSHIKYHINIYCKPSTRDGYASYIKNHIKPFFKNKKVLEITPVMIRTFMHKKIDEGLGNNTVNKIITLLGSVFQKLVDDDIIYKNPCSKIKKLSVETQEMRFLTRQEMDKILEIAQRDYSDFYPLLLTSCATGMRRGETLGLTWDNVNFLERKIYVRKSLYKGQLITPKTKTSIRCIDIPEKLARVLKEWKLACPKGELNLVFPSSTGGFMDADNMIKRRFNPVLRKAGIDTIRWHDLRHTYCSILIEQNLPVKYIQRQLGHSSIQVSMDRYGHLMPEVHHMGRQALDAVFSDKSERKMTILANAN